MEETVMVPQRFLAGVLLGLVLVAIAAPAWAADQPQPVPASAVPDPAGAEVLSVVAAAAGTVVYAPFKAVLICPFMAAASGVSRVLSYPRSTGAYLLDVGCRGTYLVTPEMIRGRAEFQGGGPALPIPERLRPVQSAS
jgi:hypothetical protein